MAREPPKTHKSGQAPLGHLQLQAFHEDNIQLLNDFRLDLAQNTSAISRKLQIFLKLRAYRPQHITYKVSIDPPQYVYIPSLGHIV